MVKDELKVQVLALITKIEGIYHPDVEKKIRRYLELTIEGIEGPDVTTLRNNILKALEIIESAEVKEGKLATLEGNTALTATTSKAIKNIEKLELDIGKVGDHATGSLIEEIRTLVEMIERLLQEEKAEAA